MRTWRSGPGTALRGLAARRGLPAGAVDALLAGGVAAVELALLWRLAGAAATERPLVFWLAVAAVGVRTVPLAFRRRAPFGVFLTVVAGALAHGPLPGPVVSPHVALYTVAASGRPWQSWAAAGIAALGAGGLFVVTGGADFVPFFAALLLAAWVLGRLTRTRRLYVEGLERDQAARARLAVAEERARIARELHDVVAHAVTVVHVQTRAARGAVRADPEAADRALAAVERSAGDALGEMRRLLAVLHEEDGTAERVPQPGIADLDALVGRFRRDGLPVRLEHQGSARPVPATVGLSAYRVVQEALTNALKHAVPRAVVVRLAWDRAAVHVEVVNDGVTGRRSAPTGLGRGLAGMRERVALLGGRMTAGPTSSGGFHVRATLPLAPTPEAAAPAARAVPARPPPARPLLP